MALPFAINAWNKLDSTKQQKPESRFYAVSEFSKTGHVKKVHFLEDRDSAFFHVTGMQNTMDTVSLKGKEYTTIQSFCAETCDIDGWNQSDRNSRSNIIYYV